MEIFLLSFPVLVLSVVIHEVAHAWVAMRQGDDTAYKLGRITLNPISHIDPFGSIIVPLMLSLSRAPVMFGWAKPVPINPRNFRNYKRGDILVSLAGICANFLLAILFTLLAVILVHLSRIAPGGLTTFRLLARMANYGIWLNLILAFFNLIPIPPLDGSHVLYHLLPPGLGARYRELGRYGFLVIMGLLFLVPQAQTVFLYPAVLLNGLAEALIRLWT
jgi:Zn-dependent protease